MTRLDARFNGNVPALVTPCDGAGRPDLAAMARLVDHAIATGAAALNVLGTTGEFSLVPPGERGAIIEAAVNATRGRAPVMIGCGRPSVSETAAEIRQAADCGADAALVTPSYYFPLTDSEIVCFISRAAEKAPIPLLYYHYPQMTDCEASVAAIVKLARAGIVSGVKDSSGDATFFARLTADTAELGDFRIFVGGSAFLLGALAHGADGVIGALSGFAAYLDNDLLTAFAEGDVERARLAQARITHAVDALFRSSRHNPAVIAKAILASFGLCSEAAFPPLDPLDESERSALLERLPALGITAPDEARNPARTPDHSRAPVKDSKGAFVQLEAGGRRAR